MNSRSMLLIGTAVLAAACTDAPERIASFAPSESAPHFSLGLPNDASADTLAIGESVQLSASLPAKKGRVRATPTVWTSSNASVATVTSSGRVTAVAAGSSTVKAANEIASEQATIVVLAAGTTPPPPPPDTTPTPPPPTDTTPTPPPPAGGSTVAAPALPQSYVNTAAVPVTGTTITVPAGGNLQSALNSALPGDQIVLTAGATYTGNFELPAKSGSGWITIRTSTPGSLPAAGQRITPAYASALPKIVTANGMSALSTAAGAHNYRIVGVEITVAAGLGSTGAIVSLGTAGSGQSSLSQVPRDIVLDRVYVHGNSTVSFQRCIALNSAWTAVIDSYVSDCHSSTNDSQAIAGWNGPGPFKIVNNFLEGASENLMFGGGDPSIANLVPSDIEIRRNHFFKPLSWQGSQWIIKNLFELKNARRVLVEGNVFENNWGAAQNGFALLFKSVNQDGGCGWCTTSDVTFQYNVVRRVVGAISMAGRPETHPAERAARLRFAHNVFEQVGASSLLQGTASGRLFQLQEALAVQYAHNTGVGTTNGFLLVGVPTSGGFDMRDNIIGGGPVIASAEGRGNGTGSLDYHVPGWHVRGNVILGAATSVPYPSGNVYASSASAAGLSTDLRVVGPPAQGSATTDGRAPGADRAMVEQKTAGVVMN